MTMGVPSGIRLSRKRRAHEELPNDNPCTSVFTRTGTDILGTTAGATTNYRETSAMCGNTTSFSGTSWLDSHGRFLRYPILDRHLDNLHHLVCTFDAFLVAADFENVVIGSSSFQASLQGLACLLSCRSIFGR
ncbi:uncharacterized protein MELLADRAFT_111302 [Melampsora larici-populina 98AG31]|uniref:Uncharacterized protein n=1 Tax=Melampsora larici-populina (strain 98AG31 / pathotype 3-4-7) TaxID=747676 RepID=F4S2P6_MELLP|nr:uncharacterized protein MELLADRAFT_111302 [Melampsora larici-populina 98AG31]EGG01092.1 hypothetical protein MELLADRAFT_111302 [Melampsora larici-populina 98AG31]